MINIEIGGMLARGVAIFLTPAFGHGLRCGADILQQDAYCRGTFEAPVDTKQWRARIQSGKRDLPYAWQLQMAENVDHQADAKADGDETDQG